LFETASRQTLSPVQHFRTFKTPLNLQRDNRVRTMTVVQSVPVSTTDRRLSTRTAALRAARRGTGCCVLLWPGRRAAAPRMYCVASIIGSWPPIGTITPIRKSPGSRSVLISHQEMFRRHAWSFAALKSSPRAAPSIREGTRDASPRDERTAPAPGGLR
jgi:hypothetical protein